VRAQRPPIDDLRGAASEATSRIRSKLLFRKLADDDGDWPKLAGQFEKVHGWAEGFGSEAVMTAYWRDWSVQLARDFSPAPPIDFLRHPIVRKTMFAAGGRLYSREVKYLETRYAPDELCKLLREDRIGRPPLRSRHYVTSSNRVHHLYHLSRFEAATRVNLDALRIVVEWGGGYGDFARVFRRRRCCTYVIIDLPLMSAIQWLYLTAVLGAQDVQLVRGDGALVDGCVNIVPVGLAELVGRADLFISTWALSESSPSAIDLATDRGWLESQHLLLAFSQGVLGERARAAGAVCEPLEVLAQNEYAFR
jgi:hypothetical protein